MEAQIKKTLKVGYLRNRTTGHLPTDRQVSPPDIYRDYFDKEA